ncbi:hypothetical protein ACLKA6_006271 [Drosophila palustris]
MQGPHFLVLRSALRLILHNSLSHQKDRISGELGKDVEDVFFSQLQLSYCPIFAIFTISHPINPSPHFADPRQLYHHLYPLYEALAFGLGVHSAFWPNHHQAKYEYVC